MDETNLVAGCAKAILEKYTEPILKGISNFCRDEWEKFKVDFDFSFKSYLENSVKKYGKIKTMIFIIRNYLLTSVIVCAIKLKKHI